MAKVKKAKLAVEKTAGVFEELEANAKIEHGKKIKLNMVGDIAKNAGGGARTAHAVARLFYRINGIPFAKTFVDEDSKPVPAAQTQFTLKNDTDFTPRHRAVYSVQILAWDKDVATHAIKDTLKHKVSRVRVQ